MLLKIQSYLSIGNRTIWCVFALLVISVFLKEILFHWFCFRSILLSSLFYAPLEFFRFWGGKIVPALFIGGFVFVFRNKLWSVVAHCLIDIWIIANMFYYKANLLFISYETMKMADNMTGFWDSLYAYTEWGMALFPLITVIYGFSIWFLPKSHNRLFHTFTIVMLLSVCIASLDNVCLRASQQKSIVNNEVTEQVNDILLAREQFVYYFPFGHVYYYSKIEPSLNYDVWAKVYIREYSIISYFPASIMYNFWTPAGRRIELTTKDKESIQTLVLEHTSDSSLTPKTNLVFLLVESLESWPINDVCGYEFMPNLLKLSRNEHTLYCEKVISQVRHGNSADGQMINVTGLLPIANGATCRLFADNIFPSYAQCFQNSAIVNPSVEVWNQSAMTDAYGFKQLFEPQKGEVWDDDKVIRQVYNYMDTVSSPYSVMGITISSHVPFEYGAKRPKYIIEDMPAILLAYLNSLFYTDSIIGDFVNAVYTNEKFAKNTTIVITGDHTIFRSFDMQLDRYAKTHNISMKTANTYTPLFVYSSSIDRNVLIRDTCYQMDIYPTIMSVIGCENYFWKGLGINLLDSTSRNNRHIFEQEAYELSELIIRSNFFDMCQ